VSRLLAWLLALAGLIGLAVTIRSALTSDETKIRWCVEEALEGFNQAALLSCLEPLHPDYRDRDTGVGREALRRLLAGAFRSGIDPASGEFLLEAGIDPQRPWSVLVDAEQGTARCEFGLRITSRQAQSDGSPRFWECDVTLDLENDLREGWRILESRHSTRAGTRPDRWFRGRFP
jgi:hypothetical protein